jgi:hypothetical protein
LIAERFGELLGQISAIMPDARSRAKDFKFANERSDERDEELVELPNPFRPGRAIN